MGMKLGELVREKRLEKGYSQTQLGKGIVTPSMISQIELGRVQPSYGVLQALAERLDSPIEYFLTPMRESREWNARLTFALWLKESKNYHQAAPFLEKLVEEAEFSRDDILWHLIDCYIQSKQYKKAEPLLNSLMLTYFENKNMKKYAQALESYGQVKIGCGEYEVAKTYFKKACKYLGSSEVLKEGKLLYKLGKCYEYSSMYQDAIQYYHEAHKIMANKCNSSDLADLYYGLAVSYRHMNVYEQAEMYTVQAIDLYQDARREKERTESMLEYVKLLCEWGRLEEAKNQVNVCIETARKLNEPSFVINGTMLLSKILYLSDEESEAERYAHIVLEQSQELEDQGCAHHLLGKLAEKRRKWYTAIEHFQKAASLFFQCLMFRPFMETASDWVECYKQLGDVQQATEVLQATHEQAVQILGKKGIVL